MENQTPYYTPEQVAASRFPMTPEQKEESINRWNNQPEIKDNKIKAIDTNTERPIKKKTFKLLEVLAVIGVIGILAIGGIFAYLAWNGELKDTIDTSLVCGNVNLTSSCPENSCPSCTAICPSLSCGNCGNVSVSPIIKVYTNETN